MQTTKSGYRGNESAKEIWNKRAKEHSVIISNKFFLASIYREK